MHEIVADVVTSSAPGLEPGMRVVGTALRAHGLAELFLNPASQLVPLSADLNLDAAAVIQPLATVLNAIERIGSVAGLDAAVIGLGPLGLLFTHVLASRGARSVAGVDLVDRRDIASSFGLTETFTGSSREWAASVEASGRRPQVCIEAVGKKQETLVDAVLALDVGGSLCCFGLPDEDCLLPMRRLFRKDITISTGITRDWQRFLNASQHYVRANPQLGSIYVTSVFGVDDAQEAFRTAARPAAGRLKVVIRTGRSRRRTVRETQPEAAESATVSDA